MRTNLTEWVSDVHVRVCVEAIAKRERDNERRNKRVVVVRRNRTRLRPVVVYHVTKFQIWWRGADKYPTGGKLFR